MNNGQSGGSPLKIAVVGAGHAGVEAALAAARMGIDTLLFTLSLDAVANMPCNPSIGGSGKGHLVYEIDALGGEMGYAADKVTLGSRTLNLGKGSAVHSKRVQADRMLYRSVMKAALEAEPHLRLIQAEITEVLTEGEGENYRVCGVKTSLGEIFSVSAVILATGTFLKSRIFVGDKVIASGPDGMLPADSLTDSLLSLGVRLLRFKTGTPARVHRRSIDLSRLEKQENESPVTPFSVRSDEAELNARTFLPCHIVYTNQNTHSLILENLDRCAMYSGNIVGTGPRYCPSIETKLVRFRDKERHQLFVEPCGADTEEMYLQGFSTSMPTDVQIEMLKTLDGFENAEIMRYAYAIEYDCADPTQLYPTLEFKSIRGLYGAGQFNGTSGYEEAAAQGLIAGINAALALRGEEPLILPRSSSYIGTLIDDLVTKGTNEPYRVMTSRSEYRLLLRQDNAELRLTEYGRRVGLIGDERYSEYLARKAMIEGEIDRMKKTVIAPTPVVNDLLSSLGSSPISTGIKLSELLRRPEITYAALSLIDKERKQLPTRVALCAEVMVKYEGYIKREAEQAERARRLEGKKLSPELDYHKIGGLRLEAAEKLSKIKPLSIGQASGISGVSPADISVLLIYLAAKQSEE